MLRINVYDSCGRFILISREPGVPLTSDEPIGINIVVLQFHFEAMRCSRINNVADGEDEDDYFLTIVVWTMKLITLNIYYIINY